MDARPNRHAGPQLLAKLLAKLLAGLAATPAIAQTPGTATDPVKTLPTVEVSGTATPNGGSDGAYRVSSVKVAPLGEQAVLDLPYSVQTIPAELIRNQGVEGNADLFKYLPSTQVEARGGMEIGRPQIRGFQADMFGNNRVDGFSVPSHVPHPVELYERLEVLGGASGAFFGPLNAGGVANAILKRPTETPLRRVSLAWEEAAQWVGRVDLGGRLGDSVAGHPRFGYRLTGMTGQGERYASNTDLRRDLAGLAVDAQVTDQLLVEANVSHYVYDQRGYPGSFAVATPTASGGGSVLPGALDPSRGYGQSFNQGKGTIDDMGVRATWKLAPHWQISGGLWKQRAARTLLSTGMSLNATGTGYTAKTSEGYSLQEVTSNQLYLNGTLHTGSLRHEVVLGTNGYESPNFTRSGGTAAVKTCTSLDLASPCSVQTPNWSGEGSFSRDGSKSIYQTYLLGDTLHFNEQWALLGVWSTSTIKAQGYSTASSNYTRTGNDSYTLGLTFKPTPNQSLYANTAHSVVPGDSAPSLASNPGIKNPGEVLSPYQIKQWELGYKARTAGLDFSSALFDIRRPFAYVGSDNTFAVQGEQQNRGVEFLVSGQASDHLTLFGGLTWLDPRLRNTGKPDTSDRLVVGVPRFQANLLAEYRISPALLPLPGENIASANLHYTGKRAANDYNSTWADGYTTLDVGWRTRVRTPGNWGGMTTYRIGINNLTDVRYWASIFPGNVNGTGGASSATLGEPRTVKLSVTLDF